MRDGDDGGDSKSVSTELLCSVCVVHHRMLIPREDHESFAHARETFHRFNGGAQDLCDEMWRSLKLWTGKKKKKARAK